MAFYFFFDFVGVEVDRCRSSTFRRWTASPHAENNSFKFEELVALFCGLIVNELTNLFSKISGFACGVGNRREWSRTLESWHGSVNCFLHGFRFELLINSVFDFKR